MVKKRWLFILLVSLLLLGLTYCASPAGDQIDPSEKAFKGMEMYSWQDENGAWWYSILIGTNRNKTVEEVMSDPLDIHKVNQRLCQLVIGEQVLWSNREMNLSPGGTVEFLMPPQDIIDGIKAQTLECKVELSISFD